MPVSKELLEVLACPKCKAGVAVRGIFLVCKSCKLAFPVLDDVPDMVIEDAWPLERAEKAGFKHDLTL